MANEKVCKHRHSLQEDDALELLPTFFLGAASLYKYKKKTLLYTSVFLEWLQSSKQKQTC